MPAASRALGILCAIVALAAGIVGPPTTAAPRTRLAGATMDLGAMDEPLVAIDPSSWWLEDGANVSLLATWVQVPPGCTLSPGWVRWTLGPGGTEGVLDGGNASRTEFVASANRSGTTDVLATAAASLDCSGSVRGVFARARAEVDVASPLTLGTFAFAVNPLGPNSTANLTGDVTGGAPPYRVRIDWGDGTVSGIADPSPGTFSIVHRFGADGAYEPTVIVTDSVGDSATARPDEPLNVSSTFALAVAPSTPVAEVGVPVAFAIGTEQAPPGFSGRFGCQDAAWIGAVGSTGLEYACTFGAPGTLGVSFEAVGTDPPYRVASAQLDEPVVPRPSVTFGAPPPRAEVGSPLYAALEVDGGVAPFSVAWSLVGAGLNGTVSTEGDGSVYLPVTAPVAGALALSVTVTDALGVASLAAVEPIEVEPALEVAATAASRPGPSAVIVNLSGNAVEGVPGFAWAVATATGAENATAPAGTFGVAGTFVSNASYRAEGTLELSVLVVDGAGVLALENLTVALGPSLSVTLNASSLGPGAVGVTLTISGGAPPYAYRWNDTLGDAGNGSVAVDGAITFPLAPAVDGPDLVHVNVTDGWGAIASAEVQFLVPSGGGASAGATDAEWLAVGVLVVAIASALLLRFRRRTAPAKPLPDPVEVLREAIEPSDGVDRGLVELLAEERGLPPEVVRSTLERLKANGTVRAGRGTDGEEVLAWSRPYER